MSIGLYIDANESAGSLVEIFEGKVVAQIYILGMSGGRRLVVRLTTLWGPLRSLPP